MNINLKTLKCNYKTKEFYFKFKKKKNFYK